MTRIVYVFKRLPGLSRKKCNRYWLKKHALLVKKHADALGIRGYSQYKTAGNWLSINIMKRMRGTMDPFDGAAHYWVDRDVMASALETPEGKQAMDELIKDEANFIDFPRSSIMVCKEYHIMEDAEPNRTSPIKKMTWVGSRLSNLTPEQYQDHYINTHGPLVKGYGDLLGIKKYDQIHLIDDPLNDTLRSLRGTGEPYLVSAEFIWDFKEMMPIKNAKQKKQAQEEIAEDEKLFIDFSKSAIWFAEEHVVIPH